MKQKNIQGNRAFTLIEILIAMGLISVVIWGVVQFMQSTQRSQKMMQSSLEFDLLRTNIHTTLHSVACDNAFQASGSTPLTLSGTYPQQIPLLKMGGSTIIDMSKPEITAGLKVSEFVIESATSEGNVTVGAKTLERFLVSIRIKAERDAQVSGSVRIFEQTFLTKVGVDASAGNAIVKCFQPDFSAPPWLSETISCSPGTFVVGIGPNGPVCGMTGNRFLMVDEPLPAGAKAISCNFTKGNKIKTKPCESDKFSCSFTSKWNLLKSGSAFKTCDAGVEIDAPPAGSISFDETDTIPTAYNLADYDMKCLVTGSTSKNCKKVDTTPITTLPAAGVAKVDECYYYNGAWNYVSKAPTTSAPTFKVCASGILLEPVD